VTIALGLPLAGIDLRRAPMVAGSVSRSTRRLVSRTTKPTPGNRSPTLSPVTSPAR